MFLEPFLGSIYIQMFLRARKRGTLGLANVLFLADIASKDVDTVLQIAWGPGKVLAQTFDFLDATGEILLRLQFFPLTTRVTYGVPPNELR